MNMDFGTSETPVKVIKEGSFEELIWDIFFLVSMVNSTESHGKNLMS